MGELVSPTVSVIIPAYNQAQFLGQALDSVLAQTFTDYEIIVVNDGSTDKTAQVLASYGDCVNVVTQVNAGLSAARNSGLSVARGKFIGFLDADDLWYPQMLSTTVSHLRRNSNVDIICGAWDCIDELGKATSGLYELSSRQTDVNNDFLRVIAMGNMFPVHALLIRRKCFNCCGFFDTTLGALEDWDMWLRMAAYGHKVELIDIPVARYRRHSRCMTLDPQRMERAFHQVLAKLFLDERVASHLVDLRDHAYLIQWLYLAEHCQEAGLKAELRRCVQMAEEIYQAVPPNKALSRRYFAMASRPELLVSYQWLAARSLLQDGEYGNAFLGILKLIVSRPDWLAQKAFLKVGQIAKRVQKEGWRATARKVLKNKGSNLEI